MRGRIRVAVLATALAVVLLASLGAAEATATPEPPSPCLEPPVAAPVTEGFRSPWCLWCSGHRGIDYSTAPGSPVRAAAGGVVRFAGPVAGTLYVVVAHPSGLRTTYGRLTVLAVSAGSRVRAGETVGTAGRRLFFGVRPASGATGRYLDPARYLLRLVRRPRLVPADGSAAPPRLPSAPGRRTCTAREAAR